MGHFGGQNSGILAASSSGGSDSASDYPSSVCSVVAARHRHNRLPSRIVKITNPAEQKNTADIRLALFVAIYNFRLNCR